MIIIMMIMMTQYSKTKKLIHHSTKNENLITIKQYNLIEKTCEAFSLKKKITILKNIDQ